MLHIRRTHLHDVSSRRLPLLLVVLTLLLLAGCTRDEAVVGTTRPALPPTSDTPVPAGSVRLFVGLPEPVQQHMSTRATASDFDVVSDLNIVIADGGTNEGKILSVVWFRPADVQDGESVVGGTDLVVYNRTAPGEDSGNAFSLHFSKTWLDYMALSSESTFILVANYGRKLDTQKITTVGELRNLEEISPAGMSGWVNEPCLLYGESENDGTHTDPDGKQSKSLKVEMKRTVAMITVQIDGRQLNENVVITPLKVSLHNVPTRCKLGLENQIEVSGDNYEPVDLTAVAAVGESKTAHDLGWGSIASAATTNKNPNVTASPVVGGHYCDFNADGTSDPSSLDYSKTGVSPLFLFENLHAPDFGNSSNTDPITKRPAGISSTKREDIEAATKSCSYLQVDALYQRFDTKNNNQLVLGGNVSFRVFLGENLLTNFDINRNHYYCLTLSLSGYAVTEGGQINGNGELVPKPDEATWRVSSTLSPMMVVGGGDIITGGNGELFPIEFGAADAKQVTGIVFKDKDGNEVQSSDYEWEEGPFVFIQDSNDKWYELNKINGSSVHMNQVNGKYNIFFYIQPMIRNVTWKGEGNTRSVTFKLKGKGDGTETDWITITQYEPIRLKIDEDSPNEVKAYATEKLKAELPVTLYIDRIDREAKPWGFEGISFDQNYNSGFDNVYNIIDPAAPDDAGAQARMNAAKNYLPFGLAYKIDANTLDYTRGSAMMHAAFMNSAQQWTGVTASNTQDALGKTSVDDLVKRTDLPQRPGEGLRKSATSTDIGQNPDLCFAWVVPSVAEWQLMERMDKTLPDGLFDPLYPVLSAFPYWSSNAGTTETIEKYPETDNININYAFTYQMNRGLDTITENDTYPARYLENRATPLRYRLIAVKPNDLGDWQK